MPGGGRPLPPRIPGLSSLAKAAFVRYAPSRDIALSPTAVLIHQGYVNVNFGNIHVGVFVENGATKIIGVNQNTGMEWVQFNALGVPTADQAALLSTNVMHRQNLLMILGNPTRVGPPRELTDVATSIQRLEEEIEVLEAQVRKEAKQVAPPPKKMWEREPPGLQDMLRPFPGLVTGLKTILASEPGAKKTMTIATVRASETPSKLMPEGLEGMALLVTTPDMGSVFAFAQDARSSWAQGVHLKDFPKDPTEIARQLALLSYNSQKLEHHLGDKDAADELLDAWHAQFLGDDNLSEKDALNGLLMVNVSIEMQLTGQKKSSSLSLPKMPESFDSGLPSTLNRQTPHVRSV